MPISTPSTTQGIATVEVDVLVVGAGAAGMTAALVSALEGLDVLLCEKSDRVGGTSATSAGTIWVPGTRQSREAGFTDHVTDAKRYLDAVIGTAPDKRRTSISRPARRSSIISIAAAR
jgi:flavin-dependent dehydrogenase